MKSQKYVNKIPLTFKGHIVFTEHNKPHVHLNDSSTIFFCVHA